EVWVPAALSVSLLCTCFILSSLVTQNNSVYSSIGKRLSKLRDHQKHLSVACRREAEGESWGCCPSAWRLFEASCYFVSTAVQPWNASREACAAWEAELAVIRTREEQDFIIQNLEDSSAYYIGLSDPEGLRHWQWVDQMLYNASATFWHPGE
ncbi:C-type lectin domain family 4 member C, partial [Heterocephalus glaber]